MTTTLDRAATNALDEPGILRGSPYLDAVADSWNRLAADDPLYAILTEPGKEGHKWDLSEFWRRGREDVRVHLAHLRDAAAAVELPLTPAGEAVALDFGCGVGRLSRALRGPGGYRQVIGLDVSPRMIDRAYELNPTSDVEFRVNPGVDIDQPAASVDLVYSQLVLQHLATEVQHAYLREFLRVLKPGGTFVAGMLTGPLKPFESGIYNPKGPPCMEVHGCAVEAVLRTVRQAGGGVLALWYDSTPLVWSSGSFAGITYYGAKSPVH